MHSKMMGVCVYMHVASWFLCSYVCIMHVSLWRYLHLADGCWSVL